MENNRITQLKLLLGQSPNDPFLVYALATEYLTLEDEKSARKYFQNLVDVFPDYVATYYHFAKLLWASGEKQNAIQLLDTGIHKATLAGEKNSLRELIILKDEFEDFS